MSLLSLVSGACQKVSGSRCRVQFCYDLKYAQDTRFGYGPSAIGLSNGLGGITRSSRVVERCRNQQDTRITGRSEYSAHVTYRSGWISAFFIRWLDKRTEKEESPDLTTQSSWQRLRIVLKAEKSSGGQDALILYVRVWNRGVKTAEDVVPHIVLDQPEWKAAGLMSLYIVPRPAYPIYLIERSDMKDTSEDRFALAVVESSRKEVMSLSGRGLPETFALIVAVKGSKVLRFPTTGPYPAFIEYPRKFKIELYFRVKDRPYTHAATYEVDARAWDKITVVQKVMH